MRSRSARIVTLGSLLAAAVLAGGCAAPAVPVPGQPGPLVSATFVSPSQGWLLVAVRCGPAFCLRLEHTTDGGRRWASVRGSDLARPALAGPIEAIRFADPRDGWAYGSRRLLATHDGGRTWQAVAIPGLGRPLGAVEALGVTDGTVDVVVADGTNPNDGGPWQLYASSVGRDDWTLVPAVGGSGPGSLTAADGIGYAAFAEYSATAAGTTVTGRVLYRSDDGRNWARLPTPPCTGTPAAATRTLLYLVCVKGAAAGSEGKLVYGSADGGRTWRHLTSAPFAGDLDGIAASPDTLLVSWGGGAGGIYASVDGGEHWAAAYAGHIPYGMTAMGMTTATRGYAIDSRSVFLVTRDAGRHWAAVRVPGGRAGA
jgi:photosystem II stability/assembly factor-like uncharacterized protein